MKKVMILGSNGMAGHVLTKTLRKNVNYQVIAVARSQNASKPDLLIDVTDFEKLRKSIEDAKPDIVVNCIGLLNQVAETNPDQAVLMNSYLPHFLEAVTKGTATKVIHISTDCVFSGSRGGYTENDFKDGKGFYAQSKALGEIDNQKDLTLRTSIIGPELPNSGGIGLFHWFSQQSGKIRGYTNAFWSGVTTIELAKAISAAIDEDLKGLYQLTSKEKISKFDLLGLFKQEIGGDSVEIEPYEGYSVDKSLICTRTGFSFAVQGYPVMLKEMKAWIKSNIQDYPHYKSLTEPR